MTQEIITEIPLADLHESPFNIRKVFHEQGLAELAADIKAHGVLSPLRVRPRVPPLFAGDANASCGFEIVFGHRRYRGAGIAGLPTAPCIVKAMSDEEAKKAQISENLQRKDVHPIEEAEGFQSLIDEHNTTAEMIVEQTGKSKAYVYGRLKLLQACPSVRHKCLQGEIGSETALLIARLRTPKLQEKALNYIAGIGGLGDGGSRSYRQIRELLAEKFTLDLGTAMFDIEDEMLVPSAGHCVRCTKRTGNAPEFSDLVESRENRYGGPRKGNADACTDPDCFESKKKAHLKREADKLTFEGKVVVTGNAARNAITAHGDIKGAYVSLKEVKGSLKNVSVVRIQDPRTGKTHQAVKREDLKAAGVTVKEAAPKRTSGYDHGAWERERKAKQATADIKNAANERLFLCVRAAMHAASPGLIELRAVAALLGELVINTQDTPGLMRAWGISKANDFGALIEQMNAVDLTRFVLDCTIVSSTTVNPYNLDEEPASLLAAAKHYGIDVDAARAEPAESASTPALAARAPEDAAAAPAAAGAKGKTNEQKDDAGVAGGSDAQVDALTED